MISHATTEPAGGTLPTDPVEEAHVDLPLARLISSGWMLPTGVAGLLGFTAKFESAVSALQETLTHAHPTGTPGPSFFTPVMPRSHIERAEYAESFPHLLAAVHALPPGTAESTVPGEDARMPTEAVLAPAACYSVYPSMADATLEASQYFDVAGSCYRHEETSEVGRFRSFRMREFVAVGTEDAALSWRADWMERCRALFTDIGLDVQVQAASDPFFGPGARFMRSSQLQQSLKYEFVAPVCDGDDGTAIASVNLHKDHLGALFAIGAPGGDPAHSSCAAFGLERIVLALIHRHGDTLSDWPTQLGRVRPAV